MHLSTARPVWTVRRRRYSGAAPRAAARSGAARNTIPVTAPPASEKSKTTFASPPLEPRRAGSFRRAARAALPWPRRGRSRRPTRRPRCGTGCRARPHRRRAGHDHVRGQQLEQPRQVPAASGGQERVDQLPVGTGVLERRLGDLVAGARGELAGGDPACRPGSRRSSGSRPRSCHAARRRPARPGSAGRAPPSARCRPCRPAPPPPPGRARSRRPRARRPAPGRRPAAGPGTAGS